MKFEIKRTAKSMAITEKVVSWFTIIALSLLLFGFLLYPVVYKWFEPEKQAPPTIEELFVDAS